MKRFMPVMAILVACVSLFAFAGCSNSTEDSNSNTQESTTDTTDPEAGDTDPEADNTDSETGDTNSEAENTDAETGDSAFAYTDDEILEMVAPYLEDLVFQDPSAYDSFNDFLKANFNLEDTDISAATLYLGAPNQNTGCFVMLTPTADADLDLISQRLTDKGDSMVETAKQGYTQGYSEYSVLQSDGRFFLVMQADADQYNELVTLISEL